MHATSGFRKDKRAPKRETLASESRTHGLISNGQTENPEAGLSEIECKYAEDESSIKRPSRSHSNPVSPLCFYLKPRSFPKGEQEKNTDLGPAEKQSFLSSTPAILFLLPNFGLTSGLQTIIIPRSSHFQLSKTCVPGQTERKESGKGRAK